jgi:hypothetical protein
VILSGKRNLTDLDYQRRNFYPTDDYLCYEKNLLHHLFREEFGKLKS